MLFVILLVLLLIGGGVTFIAMQNLTQPVHLVLFSWQTPNIPLGVCLVIAFLLGAILIYVVAVLSAASDRNAMKVLLLRVSELEEQVPQLKKTSSTPSGDLSKSTGPLMPMPGVNAPLPGRLSTSPLQNFRQ